MLRRYNDGIPRTVFKTERISWAKLQGHQVHDRRESGDLRHVALERSHLNRTLFGGLDDARAFQHAREFVERVGAKQDPRNERPVTRHLFGASPEYFRPADPKAYGTWDPVRLEEWVEAVVSWCASEGFTPDRGWTAVLHLDERTPHVHLVGPPSYERVRKVRGRDDVKPAGTWLSHHEHPAYKGKNSLSKLLDRYAAAVAPLGIRRGDPLSSDDMEPTDKATWAENLMEEARTAQAQAAAEKDQAQAQRRAAKKETRSAELKQMVAKARLEIAAEKRSALKADQAKLDADRTAFARDREEWARERREWEAERRRGRAEIEAQTEANLKEAQRLRVEATMLKDSRDAMARERRQLGLTVTDWTVEAAERARVNTRGTQRTQ